MAFRGNLGKFEMRMKIRTANRINNKKCFKKYFIYARIRYAYFSRVTSLIIEHSFVRIRLRRRLFSLFLMRNELNRVAINQSNNGQNSKVSF